MDAVDEAGKSGLDVMEEFGALVGQEVEEEEIDLARAALALARTEYPGLDPETYIGKLDELSARVARLEPDPGDAHSAIAALNQVLYAEENFRGNCADYYDPRNSFLNDVLDRKLGIPITLALVYMEVGRRIGLPLVGVGMPGHFLLKHYDIEGRELLIDTFDGGQIVTPLDCQRRLDDIYSSQLALQPDFLFAVSRRQMLTRILNNLKTVYLSTRNFKRALPICDLILAIYPRSPEDVKQRALLRYSLGMMRSAVQDLDDYLKMVPDASDADEVRQTAVSIRRALAMMN
jgi:regulator of sirC expression with transglutaminase-like and TPR domain